MAKEINVRDKIKPMYKDNKLKLFPIPVTDGLEETVIAVSNNEIKTVNPWIDMYGNTEYFLNVYIKDEEVNFVKFSMFATEKEYNQYLNSLKQTA